MIKHTCSKCKKEFEWSAQSCCYGSYRDYEDGNPIEKACSIECGIKLWGKGYLKRAGKTLYDRIHKV